MDLTDFLLARIAEDEDRAKRAAFGWGAKWSEENDLAEDWATVHADGKRDMVGCEDRDVTTHIAHHDPARVLYECEAARAIIANHLRHAPGERGYGASRLAVQWLAKVHRDHPDFDARWKNI